MVVQKFLLGIIYDVFTLNSVRWKAIWDSIFQGNLHFLFSSELKSFLIGEKEKGSKERKSLRDELQELKDLITLRREELENVVMKRQSEEATMKEHLIRNEKLKMEERQPPIILNGSSENERTVGNNKPEVNEDEVDAAVTGDEKHKTKEMRVEDLEAPDGVNEKYKQVN